MMKVRFWKVLCSEIPSSCEGMKKPTPRREIPGLHVCPLSPGFCHGDIEELLPASHLVSCRTIALLVMRPCPSSQYPCTGTRGSAQFTWLPSDWNLV